MTLTKALRTFHRGMNFVKGRSTFQMASMCPGISWPLPFDQPKMARPSHSYKMLLPHPDPTRPPCPYREPPRWLGVTIKLPINWPWRNGVKGPSADILIGLFYFLQPTLGVKVVLDLTSFLAMPTFSRSCQENSQEAQTDRTHLTSWQAQAQSAPPTSSQRETSDSPHCRSRCA